MCFYRDDYQILLSRRMMLFSKLDSCNQMKFSRLSSEDIESLIRFCYILGEPLWGKQSYLFSQ